VSLWSVDDLGCDGPDRLIRQPQFLGDDAAAQLQEAEQTAAKGRPRCVHCHRYALSFPRRHGRYLVTP
jgi:hypothetical protein